MFNSSFNVWYRMAVYSFRSFFFLQILLEFTLTITFARYTLIENRIVNGKDGHIQEFPFQVSVRRNTIHICGGSVINTQWVITAAHCVDGFENRPNLFTLRVGSSSYSNGGAIVTVSHIYKHPSYNSKSMNFDVALLRTQRNKLRGEFVNSIEILPENERISDNKMAIVSGWGHMSTFQHVLSPLLKYTTVYIVNQEICSSKMKSEGVITDGMFCAAARNTDACQGDSGGPIQSEGKLIGIVSWGVGCANPHYPGVYTRLAYPAIRLWVHLMTGI